ncbi:MAG: AAA family ATPase [Cyanobacteriota bacterium]
MIIKTINIDGFGIYNNYSCKALSGGLNFLYGLNESGKSTLLAFLRACLFNMSKPRGKDFPYLPVSGGKHGGNIVVQQDDQEFTIERYFGKKNESNYYDMNGNKLNENDLLNLLSLRNKLFFETIFAFGLDELRDLDTLEEEEIKQYIYSTSLGIDSNLLRQSEKILTDNIDEIYKPSGKKQYISDIRSDINQLDTLLANKYRNIDEYKRLNDEILSAKENIDSIKIQLRNYKISKRKQESFKEEYNNVLDYQHYIDELNLLRDVPNFDVDLYDEYKLYLKDYKNSETQIKDLEEKITRKTEEINNITINNSLIENKAKFLRIVANETYVNEAIGSLPKRKEDIHNENNKIEQIRLVIGTHWSDDLIKTFNTTLDVKNYARQTMDYLEGLSSDISRYEKDLSDKESQLSSINDELKFQKDQLQTLNIRNREDYNKKIKILEKLKYLRSSYSELIEMSKDLKISDKTIFYNNLFSKSRIFAVIALVLIIIISFALAIMGIVDLLATVIICITSIICLMPVVYFSSKGISKEVNTNKFDTSTQDIEKIKVEITETLKQSLNESVESKVDLNFINLKIAKIEASLNNADKCITAIDKFLNSQQTINSELQDKKEKLNKCKNNEMEGKNNWINWLKSISVDDSFTPKTFLDLYDDIKVAQGCLNNITNFENRITQFTEKKENGEKELKDFLELTNLSIDTDNFSTAIKLIDDILNEQTEMYNRLKHLKEDVKQFNSDLEDLKSNKLIAEKHLTDILVKTSSQNEDELKNNVSRIAQKQELEKTINNLKTVIHRKATELNLEFDQFIDSIKNKNRSELEEEIIQLNSAIEELEESKEKLQTTLGSLTAKAQSIMQDSTMSDLHNQKEAKIQELNQYAKEWIIDKMLLTFINYSKRDYERNKQPLVITEANKVFNILTNNKYSRIIKSIEDNELRIEDCLQRSKTIDQLSQGTREQLYLALRMGYIREYSKNHIKYPIIFDDIFVNFDPYRLIAVLNTLKELSKDYQILFLSCHPEMKDFLEHIEAEYNYIELTQEKALSV